MNMDKFIQHKNDGTYSSNEYLMITLSKYVNSYFIGNKGNRLILNSNNQISIHEGVLLRNPKFFNKFDGKIDIIENFDNVFLFTDDYGDRNFAHWFYEQFIVIIYLIDLIKYIPNIKIIINKNRRESMKQNIKDALLLINGVSEENIYEMDLSGNGTAIKANNIYIGNGMRCGMPNVYNVWKKIKSKLIVNDSNQSKYGEKLYFSRRKTNTNTRKLTNIDEISNHFIDKCYNEIFLEELSLKNKINLLSNSKKVILEIGAGLLNFIFIENEVDVTILVQNSPANHNYIAIWRQFLDTIPIKYNIIWGETIEGKRDSNPINTPWKLNINLLKDI